MATPTYDPIASTTLTSSASSVTFSSLDTIAAGYRDLVLVMEVKTVSGGVGTLVQVNGDTASNYYNVTMYGTGSSAASRSLTQGGYFTEATARNYDWTLYTLQIMDFAETNKHKSALIRSNRGDIVSAVAARWANTSAITSVTIPASGDQWAAGSTFSLYGIAA